MRESDLYLPLKSYLESHNYEVKSEVHNCDVMAIRADEEPLIIELKLTLNLNVVLQAVDRLNLTPKVYIGVPSDCSVLKKKRKQSIKLLRMLGLGLIAIAPKGRNKNVKVLLDPGAYRPRQSKFRKERLLNEFNKRVGDPNLGGMANRKGIMTAYRQQAIGIADYLVTHGRTKASIISKHLNEPKARDILYRDVYGWFDRVSNGIYDISPRGRREINAWKE